MKIAFLVPLCSRNQNYSSLEDTGFYKYLLPTFEKTRSPGYEYVFYLGFDDDDVFYQQHRAELERKGFKTLELKGCQHAPAKAWSQIFKMAYDDGADYFYQLGDDTLLKTPGWTERFIEALQKNGNLGVAGPCDPVNHFNRVRLGRRIILEISFVHRTHWEIHHTFYHPEIKNWYCDDWISEVYRPYGFFLFEDINFTNTNRQERYAIDHCPNFEQFKATGLQAVEAYIKTKSL